MKVDSHQKLDMTDQTPNRWAETPEKGSAITMEFMAWASLTFGRKTTRPLVYLIAFFYTSFASQARNASREYLAKVLGQKPSFFDVYRHFLYFSSVTHDRLYMLAEQFDNFQFSIDGQKEIADALSNSRGIILYGAHFGSLEAMRYTAKKAGGLKVSLLMHEQNSRKLMQVFYRISPEFAGSIINLGTINTMLTVKDRIAQGHMIGILADRSVINDYGKERVFLGAPAIFPVAPFRLSSLFRCNIFFIAGIYLGGKKYKIVFRNLNPANSELSIEELQAVYACVLEEMCRLYPFNWFNFFDFWGGE